MNEYKRKTWVDGEVIDAPCLNNIETGIVEANAAAAQGLTAANNAANAANTAAKAAEEAKEVANSKAPAYTYGTEEIEAGSASTEPEGSLHFVIE